MLLSCLNFPAFPIFSLPCLPSYLSRGFLPTPASNPPQPSQGKCPPPAHMCVPLMQPFVKCKQSALVIGNWFFGCNTCWGGPQRCGASGPPTSSPSTHPSGLWGRVQQNSTGTIKYCSPFLNQCQLRYQHHCPGK